MSTWVYGFDQIEDAEQFVGGEWEDVRGLLGGKGANLGDMTRIGVPVPPGFTITTEACNAYLEAGEEFPKGMWKQVRQALAHIEEETGKSFGDPEAWAPTDVLIAGDELFVSDRESGQIFVLDTKAGG